LSCSPSHRCVRPLQRPEHERIVKTTQPTYDNDTGRLVELTFDRNRNGTVDTWTEMDGSRMLRSRSDLDEDGTIDRWEYYDDRGGLMKVGFSRAHDGREDAWALPDRTAVSCESRSPHRRIQGASIAGNTTRGNSPVGRRGHFW
jgi:hypothetical protein